MTTQQDDKKILEELINAFFSDLGLTDMTAEKKREQVRRVISIVEGRSIVRLISTLTPEQRVEFDGCDSDEQIEAFLQKHGIDLGAITMEEAQRYREELLENAAYVQGRIDATPQEEGEAS